MVESVAAYHDLVRRDVFGLIPPRAGRVLDVGGGIGATGAALKAAKGASHVVVIDQISEGYAPGVDQAYSGDLEDPALVGRAIAESGPFDTILCLDVLEHLRDPWAMVSILHQGLAPGGSLVVCVPNVNHLSVVGPLVLYGRFDLVDAGVRDRTHLRWFVRQSAIALATGSGLVLEELQSLIWARKRRLMDRLSFGMLNRFFAEQYAMRVCRKDLAEAGGAGG